MKKKSMQRSFAMGGAIGGLTVDPLSNNYDEINAERTQRWAADDAAQKARYGGPTQPAAAAGLTIGTTPQAAPALPGTGPTVQHAFQTTSFQQDSDARQARITSYADKLRQMEANGRANSLMGSESSINRSFADGGAVRAETADELMARMSAKYGVPAAGGPVGMTPAQAAQQQQAPQPAPQPKPAAAQGIIGIMRNRGQQIDKAAGYSRGGKIRGPGTPLSDSIPAVVEGTGEPIRVANEERIVSKEQDDFLEKLAQGIGFGSLDEMLETATGKPVGPTIKSGKRAAADGLQPATYRPEMNGISWTDKSFDPQKEQPAQGTGVIAIKSGPNAGRNYAIGTQQYTAADGTQTSDWSKTAQYAQGLAQAQRYRDTLATMQRDRLERDAFSPEITDPHVQANARAQIAEQDAKAAKQGDAMSRQLENQIKLQKLSGDSMLSNLQAAYLNEPDAAKRETIAGSIRGVMGKDSKPTRTLQHVETSQGLMVFDPSSGSMTPVAGPDGKPISGKASSTEDEKKSAGYALRMQAALDLAKQIGIEDPSALKPGLLEKTASYVNEPLANSVRSSNRQRIDAANADALDAALTLATGAAYTKEQLAGLNKAYFPQIGDDDKTIADKNKRFNDIVSTARLRAGNMNPQIDKLIEGKGQRPASEGQGSHGLKVGTVDSGRVYLGGNPADPSSWAKVN